MEPTSLAGRDLLRKVTSSGVKITEDPFNSTGSSKLKSTGDEGNGGRGPDSKDLCAPQEVNLEAAVTIMDCDRSRFTCPFSSVTDPGSEISEMLFRIQSMPSLNENFREDIICDGQE